MRLTLSQYIDIYSALQAMDLVEVIAGDKLSKTSSNLLAEYPDEVYKIVSVGTGKDVSEIKQMPSAQVIGMLELIVSSINVSKPVAPPVSFVIDDIEFLPPEHLYLQDELGEDVVKHFGQFEFGDTLESLRLSELANGNYKMMPYVLAYLYKEQPETMNINERAKLFMELDFEDAYAAYFFLSSSNNGFMRASLNQLRTIIEQQNTSEPPKQGVRDAWQNLVTTVRSVLRVPTSSTTKQ